MSWIEIGIVAVGIFIYGWVSYQQEKKYKARLKAEQMAKAGHRFIHTER